MGLAYLVLDFDRLFGLEDLARVAPEGNEVRHAHPRIDVGPIYVASWKFLPEMLQTFIV